MFPVDSLPPQYCEERLAAEAARELSQQQLAGAVEAQNKAPSATQQATPSSLGQASLSRPGSSSVLSSIFQGLVRRQSTPAQSAASSAAPSRAQTPAMVMSREEKEKAEIAERERDAGICALPSWH